MGIGFTLKTLKALNSFDINCFVLKVSKHWVSVLSYNYVWPRGPALFATLGVPNAAGSPETCRRASSHACYSTVTPICSVADLSRSNPNKPVFQGMCLPPPSLPALNEQGNYSLRRPPKLIINKNIH